MGISYVHRLSTGRSRVIGGVAGRAGRDTDAEIVEMGEDRLAIGVFEGDVRGVREPFCRVGRAVNTRI